MEKKIASSEQKAQVLRALLHGQTDAQTGEELLSTLVRLSTERVLREALEHEQAEALGRGRYEARGEKNGYCNGYETGMLKTAEGVLIRVSERWGKKCFSEFEQHQIHSLRGRLKLDEHAVSTEEPTIHLASRRSAESAA